MTDPYHPVVIFPHPPTVLDLSGAAPSDAPPPVWSVGRYGEDRTIYTQPLFAGRRTVHMGIDLGGPVGVAVHAFAAGEVVDSGDHRADGDYGPTLVTRHTLADGRPIYALFGHLSRASLQHSPVGRRFAAGEVLGWLGAPEVNGGWPPHVHLQLAWERPVHADLPGAVAREDVDDARRRYPDPALVLGPLP